MTTLAMNTSIKVKEQKKKKKKKTGLHVSFSTSRLLNALFFFSLAYACTNVGLRFGKKLKDPATLLAKTPSKISGGEWSSQTTLLLLFTKVSILSLSFLNNSIHFSSTPMGVDYEVIRFDMEVQPLVTHFMRERYLHRSFAYAKSVVGIDVVSVHKLFAYRVVSTVSTDIVSSHTKYCRIAYGITR